VEKRTWYSEVVGRRGAIVFCELLAFCLVVVAVDPVDLFRTPVSTLSTASPSRCSTVKKKLKSICVEGGEIMEDYVLIFFLSSHSGGKLMSLNT